MHIPFLAKMSVPTESARYWMKPEHNLAISPFCVDSLALAVFSLVVDEGVERFTFVIGN